jgi:hypothetical protein
MATGTNPRSVQPALPPYSSSRRNLRGSANRHIGRRDGLRRTRLLLEAETLTRALRACTARLDVGAFEAVQRRGSGTSVVRQLAPASSVWYVAM